MESLGMGFLLARIFKQFSSMSLNSYSSFSLPILPPALVISHHQVWSYPYSYTESTNKFLPNTNVNNVNTNGKNPCPLGPMVCPIIDKTTLCLPSLMVCHRFGTKLPFPPANTTWLPYHSSPCCQDSSSCCVGYWQISSSHSSWNQGYHFKLFWWASSSHFSFSHLYFFFFFSVLFFNFLPSWMILSNHCPWVYQFKSIQHLFSILGFLFILPFRFFFFLPFTSFTSFPLTLVPPAVYRYKTRTAHHVHEAASTMLPLRIQSDVVL